MVSSPLRLWAALIPAFAFILSWLPGNAAELTQDQVTAAKSATGLLISSRGSGTAFCVSESGIFVTCKHAIDQIDEKTLAIVIDPSQKTEKRYPAKIVTRLKDSDLAILKANLDRPVPVLKFGTVDGLFETEQVYAFGYPFGNALAVDEKSSPNISVNIGRITSLRMNNGALDVIQLDAQLNPGNSGGPVLDSNGKVVGVVSSGVMATGINFAIPISQLTKAIDTPIVGIDAPTISAQHQSEPTEFTATVDWLLGAPKDQAVTIEVRGEAGPRKVAAELGKDGKFRAQIVPIPSPKVAEKAKLTVNLKFESGEIAGTVSDLDIASSSGPKALGSIGSLERASGHDDFTANGKPIGVCPELGALKLDLGGTVLTVDARKAIRIDIHKPDAESHPVYYKAIVTTAEGKSFPSEEKMLVIHSSQVATAPVLQGKVDLTGVREISLPSPVSDVASAQDGRTLLLHLRESKKLAVFDVMSLKVRGYINLAEDRVLFAGGSRSVLVLEPNANVIERFSLETLLREKTINNPFGEVRNLSMGRSSPGIALVVSGDKPFQTKAIAFDVDRMIPVATAEGNQISQLDASASGLVVRSSADGRTYGCCRTGTSPSGFSVLTFRDNAFNLFYEHESSGLLVPNADGSQIFTSQSGIYTNKGASVLRSQGNWADGTCHIPSYHPMYFLGIPYGSNPGQRKQATRSVDIYLTGSTLPLLQMEPLKEMQNSSSDDRMPNNNNDPMTFDKRYHFFPQLDLLLTIPHSNDKIVARPVNVRQLLDQKGIDYLYVSSTPPPATVSANYRYKMEAMSKAGGVTFSLQSGPQGLTVSSEGEVTWKTPAQPTEEVVIVSLKDSTGQENVQTFRIAVLQ